MELDDETKRLSDVRPFQPMLKVVEKSNRENRLEKVIQAQLSVLLGKRQYDDSVCCGSGLSLSIGSEADVVLRQSKGGLHEC